MTTLGMIPMFKHLRADVQRSMIESVWDFTTHEAVTLAYIVRWRDRVKLLLCWRTVLDYPYIFIFTVSLHESST